MVTICKKLMLVLLLCIPLFLFGIDFTREWEYEGTEYYLEYYPENKNEYEKVYAVLEEVRHLTINGLYREASEKIQSHIRSYDIESKDSAKLSLLYILVKIDAAIDYYLINDKRSGVNKNYILSYICDRLDRNRVYMIENNLHGFFPLFAETTSLLRMVRYGYDSYQIFQEYVYYLNTTPIGELGYIKGEYESSVCSYYFYNTKIFNADKQYELMYDDIVELLFYMSDYKDDIRIGCGDDPHGREVFRRILLVVGEEVPVIDLKDIQSIEIYVTHRKDKAVEFFNRYYYLPRFDLDSIPQ